MKPQDSITNIVMERLDNNNNPLPRYMSREAAAFDLQSCLSRPHKIKTNCSDSNWQHSSAGVINLSPNQIILIPTGFKIQLEQDQCLSIFLRSSVGTSGLTMPKSPVIIDSDYRGEIFIPLYNRSNKTTTIRDGERLAQGRITGVFRVEIVEGEVDDTERGIGGFGSTNS